MLQHYNCHSCDKLKDGGCRCSQVQLPSKPVEEAPAKVEEPEVQILGGGSSLFLNQGTFSALCSTGFCAWVGVSGLAGSRTALGLYQDSWLAPCIELLQVPPVAEPAPPAAALEASAPVPVVEARSFAAFLSNPHHLPIGWNGEATPALPPTAEADVAPPAPAEAAEVASPTPVAAAAEAQSHTVRSLSGERGTVGSAQPFRQEQAPRSTPPAADVDVPAAVEVPTEVEPPTNH